MYRPIEAVHRDAYAQVWSTAHLICRRSRVLKNEAIFGIKLPIIDLCDPYVTFDLKLSNTPDERASPSGHSDQVWSKSAQGCRSSRLLKIGQMKKERKKEEEERNRETTVSYAFARKKPT